MDLWERAPGVGIPRAGHQRTLAAGETPDNDTDRMTWPADVRQSPASAP